MVPDFGTHDEIEARYDKQMRRIMVVFIIAVVALGTALVYSVVTQPAQKCPHCKREIWSTNLPSKK